MNLDVLDNFERPNDVYVPGDCDQSIWSLCEKLGWLDDLQALHKRVNGAAHSFGAEKKAESEEQLASEKTVDQLAKELAEELKLDKEEDGEIRRVGEAEQKAAKSDTWDDETVVIIRKDAESPKSEDPKVEEGTVEIAKVEGKGEEAKHISKREDKTSNPKEKL